MPNYLLQKQPWLTDNYEPDESRLLLEVFRGWMIGPDKAGPEDFTPNRVLYKWYYDRWFAYQADKGKLMTPQEFGATFRRFFGFKGASQEPRSRPWVEGKRVSGMRYVRGPGSVKVQCGPGLPKRILEARRKQKC